MASPKFAVLQNGWSASTLLSGIGAMDRDCLSAIKQELPDDPEQLQKLHEVRPCMSNMGHMLYSQDTPHNLFSLILPVLPLAGSHGDGFCNGARSSP